MHCVDYKVQTAQPNTRKLTYCMERHLRTNYKKPNNITNDYLLLIPLTHTPPVLSTPFPIPPRILTHPPCIPSPTPLTPR